MAEQLNPYIKELAFQAFCDSSAQLLGPISHRIPLLTQEVFADFLKIIFQEYGIIEYTITDSSGSCLLITTEGIVKILLMKHTNDFKNACDIAASNGATNVDVLEALKNRRAFPFAGTEHSYFNSDPTQWKNVMIPMKKQEDLNLYYGITEVPEKVMSFDHYVKKIWKSKAN